MKFNGANHMGHCENYYTTKIRNLIDLPAAGLKPDQLGNFERHIGKNGFGISVRSNVLQRFFELGKEEDYVLVVDKWSKFVGEFLLILIHGNQNRLLKIRHKIFAGKIAAIPQKT